MTLAYWCILMAAILPYFAGFIAKAQPQYDNSAPRAQLEQATGFRKRAYWAHLNGFEAFPPFAAAVIIAQQMNGNQAMINGLAVAFIGFRLLHMLCYVMDWATMRSLVWAGGFVCMVGLFLAAAKML
jgi:uncharacterized MAPEG superfamily protein